jgi:RNA recognition motif-containing protein
VFVGGIPQTVDQTGLYIMFSKIGKVKKAWLQLFHADRKTGQPPAEKKHRGFGFVIFYDKQSIDKMLGDECSRFVCFDDLKLDVKRAVGKTSAQLPSKPQQVTKASKPEQSSPILETSQSQSSESAKTPGKVAAMQENTLSPTYVQASTPIAVPVVPMTWQHASGQVIFMVQPCTQLPPVPPFPGTATPAQVAAQPFSVQPSAEPQPARQVLLDTLLDGFVGPKPVDNQHLKEVLLQAMPECYDD